MSMSAANSDSSPFPLASWEKGEPDTPLRDRHPGRGLESGRSVRAGRGEGRLVAQGFFGVGPSGTAAPLPVRLANEFVQRPASFRIEVDVPAFRLVWCLEKAGEFTVLEVQCRRSRTTMSRSWAAETRQRGAEGIGGRTCCPWSPGRVRLARCRPR